MDLNLLVQPLPKAPARRDNASERIEQHYRLGEPLGRGAYGVVSRCTHLLTGNDFAVKAISKRMAGSRGLRAVYSEVEILQLLRHCNIVELVETFESPDSLYIVLELVSGGELLTQVVGLPRYTENLAKRILASLLHAVEFMHKKGVVHRDLKPANLLWSRPTIESVIKVADFGFSKLIGEERFLSGVVGTVAFMAPEVLAGDAYGKAVDMWSCGVIAYLLLGGTLPFIARGTRETLDAIQAGLKFPRRHGWDKVSHEAKDLLGHLMQRDPCQRWPASNALLHPWLRSGATPEGNEPLPECLEGLGRYHRRQAPAPAADRLSAGGGGGGGGPAPAGGAAPSGGGPARGGPAQDEFDPLVPVPTIQAGSRRDTLPQHNSPKGEAMPIPNTDSDVPVVNETLSNFLEAVQSDHALRKLAVAQLGIGDDRLPWVLHFVEDHPAIVELDLSGNPLTAASSPVLLRFARQNLLMQNVWLAGTQVPQDVVSEIADVLRNRRKKTLPTTSSVRMPAISPTTHSIVQVRSTSLPDSTCVLVQSRGSCGPLDSTEDLPPAASFPPPIRPKGKLGPGMRGSRGALSPAPAPLLPAPHGSPTSHPPLPKSCSPGLRRKPLNR